MRIISALFSGMKESSAAHSRAVERMFGIWIPASTSSSWVPGSAERNAARRVAISGLREAEETPIPREPIQVAGDPVLPAG